MKKLTVVLLLVFLSIADLIAFDQEKVDDWWNQNDFESIEKYCKQEIKENNAAAYQNLFLLYQLFQREDEAIEIFEEGLEYFKPAYPYIQTMLYSIKLSDKKTAKIYRSQFENKENDNRISVKAKNAMITYYRDIGKEKKSEKLIDELGLIKHWKLIGPFDNISASGYDKVYPPETEFNPDLVYQGKDNRPIKWFDNVPMKYYGWVDLLNFLPYYNSVNYANTFVFSRIKQRVEIRFGTSGAVKFFLNDSLLLEYQKETNNSNDTFILETELQAGWNRLLIKLAFSEIERCNFALRITDLEGIPLENLEYSTAKREYLTKPSTNTKILTDQVENYFQNKIEDFPERLLNYIFLAEHYLHLGRFGKAEITLQNAYKRFPNSVLIDYYLILTFSRNNKHDFAKMKIEKIDQKFENIKIVIIYKIHEYLLNEEYDKVFEYLEKYRKYYKKDAEYYNLLFQYYAKKDLVKEWLETLDLAYKKFPDDYEIVSMKTLYYIEAEKDYRQAIRTIKKFIREKQTYQAYKDLSYIYLEDQNISSWEKTMRKMHKLFPTSPWPLYLYASGLFDLKRYDEAKNLVLKAVKINPYDDSLWKFLASCDQMLANKQSAINYYQKAIQNNPLNYSARDLLRELTEKKSIFDIFKDTNIDSLIANASTAEDYPEDEAVIILEEKNTVVYPQGGFHSHNELLVRILNKAGVSSWTEYTIPIISNNQEIVIEDAITYKSNGSKIKADINGNYIVFKQLEEEDFVYIRWKIKNFYRGKLITHFWDKQNFNYGLPVEQIQYSILFAEKKEPPETFQYQLANFSIEPQIWTSEEGIIYEWKNYNEPAIEWEDLMPSLEDVGKVLYLTTIPDWQFIIDWYHDLAHSKAEVSYEIKEKVQELIAEHNPNTDEEKIKMIYKYITENITYSSVSFRQSGLIPQKARDVLLSKIGDCKDVSILSIAMLKELAIKADMTLVATRYHNKPQKYLPTIDIFDHLITSIKRDSIWLYLDHTAHNYSYETTPNHNIGAYILQICNEFGPKYLEKSNFLSSNIKRDGKLEVHADKSITVKLSNTKSGYYSARMRDVYRELDDTKRKKHLIEAISNNISNVTLIDYQFPAIDSLNYKLDYDYSYKADKYINETGSFLFLKIPWSEKLSQTSALSYKNRNYPLVYWSYGDEHEQVLRISLPPEFELIEMIPNKQFKNKYGMYSLTSIIKDDQIILTRNLKILETKVVPEDYQMFKIFYNNIVEADDTTLLLRRK